MCELNLAQPATPWRTTLRKFSAPKPSPPPSQCQVTETQGKRRIMATRYVCRLTFTEHWREVASWPVHGSLSSTLGRCCGIVAHCKFCNFSVHQLRKFRWGSKSTINSLNSYESRKHIHNNPLGPRPAEVTGPGGNVYYVYARWWLWWAYRTSRLRAFFRMT